MTDIHRDEKLRPKTIHEFADAIGVSATTISRTLTGRGRVSASTRQMVLTSMAEMGYTPNATAQRLVTGRTHTILLDSGKSPLFGDLYVIELVDGIRTALLQRDYGLLVHAPGGDPLRAVTSGSVDGVIVVGGDNTGEDDGTHTSLVAERISALGMPCVAIGHEAVGNHPGVGSVVIGLETGARQAAQMLFAQGHRRIGFLSSLTAEDSMFLAFRNELTKLGVFLSDDQVIVAGKTAEAGERAMRQMLCQPHAPTAIFTRTDTLAAGALRAARRMGVRIPEDVSLIGHDDVPFASLVEPPLTTVRVDCVRLGETAAEMLLELLDNPGVSLSPRVVPTQLICRDTVVAPNLTKL